MLTQATGQALPTNKLDMKIVEMVMPPMGESIMECTVLHLLKKAGEPVSIDDSVLEVATDKVDTEVPCPFSGKIAEWLVKENDVVAIGSIVARIEIEGESADTQQEPYEPQEELAEVVETASFLEKIISRS